MKKLKKFRKCLALVAVLWGASTFPAWGFTVTIDANTGTGTGTLTGTVTPPSGPTEPVVSGQNYPNGSVFTFTATPDFHCTLTRMQRMLNITGGSWSNLSGSYTPTDNFTVRAEFAAIPSYTITYAGSTETTTPSPTTEVVFAGETAVGSSSAAIASTSEWRYTWDGWYDGATKVSNNMTWGPSNVQGAKTYTSQAHKTAAWVNIYYEPNSGVGSTITQTVAYGVAATTPVATVFSRPGYTIDAWAPNADGSGTTVNPNASYTNTGSITFYAKWKGNAKVARSAKVKVGSTAGANDYAATSLITPGTTVYLTASNDSVGYDFDSWSGVTSIEGQTGLSASFVMPAADVSVKAVFKPKNYAVIYNGNNASGGTIPPPGTKPHGLAYTIVGSGHNPGGLYRLGFSFKGWNLSTTATASATIAATDNQDTVLYAVWNAITVPPPVKVGIKYKNATAIPSLKYISVFGGGSNGVCRGSDRIFAFGDNLRRG